MNYAISRNFDGLLEINLNLSGPNARLQAIRFQIAEDDRDKILDALASGAVERAVLSALERWYRHEAAQ